MSERFWHVLEILDRLPLRHLRLKQRPLPLRPQQHLHLHQLQQLRPLLLQHQLRLQLRLPELSTLRCQCSENR